MIGNADILAENQLAILTLTRDCVSCSHCGDKPSHRYESGCRFIGCERAACVPSITDGGLVEGFQDWNRQAARAASEKRLRDEKAKRR